MTNNDLGVELEEIEKKKISEALLREKKIERHSPGKKKLRGLAGEAFFIRKGFPEKNKFISKISSAPPDH